MKVIFVSPSYKRAGNVKVRKVIKDIILAVHEFEEKDYREKEGGELIIIPDNLRGNMARIRNFILEECYKKSDYVVMMDDDVSDILYHENGKRVSMKEKDIKDFVVNGFIMCEDMDIKLFGLNLLDDRKAYREYSPYSTLSVVLGPFCGHIKSSIRYDERLGLKEDYDYSLQHLRKYKGILRFNKYSYTVDHITGSGGCTSYRVREEEERQIRLFQKKWSRKVVKIKDSSINPVIKCPLRGI